MNLILVILAFGKNYGSAYVVEYLLYKLSMQCKTIALYGRYFPYFLI